jgi:hypothetical protein
MLQPKDEIPLAEDKLKGAKAIGEFIGESDRRTHHLLAQGAIPAKKIGHEWISSKSALRKHYAIDPVEAKS